MRVTPEARLVTLCVRESQAATVADLRAAAAAVRDWDAVVVLATRHRVAAQVQEGLARAGIRRAPVAQALREQAVRSLAQVMLLDAELERAGRALVEASVPVIVLKGPVLARTLYRNAALRPYGDIDLTVRPADEAAAVTALQGAGYEEMQFEAEEARRAHGGHHHHEAAFHRQFTTAGGRAVIELHIDPLQLGFRPVCEASRWRRAAMAPGLPGLLMLCPEDQVVQLAVHAQKHGFSRLIWLKDLDLLMRARGAEIDWDLVTAVARQEGVSASVWQALDLAALLLRTPVPRAATARLRPPLPLRLLYRAVWPAARIANLDGQMRRRAVQFHAAEAWRGTLPSLILMGRRRERARATLGSLFHGTRRGVPTRPHYSTLAHSTRAAGPAPEANDTRPSS